MIEVIDDFCPNADEVRRSALGAGFGTWSPGKGDMGASFYPGVGFWGDHASMFTRVLQLDRWIGLAGKAKAEADKAQGIADQCELALASAQGKLEEAEGQLSFARGERDKWGEEQAKICVRTAEALSEAQAKADKAKKALRLAKSQREAFDEKAKDRLERARQLAEAKSAADGKLLLAINARDSARMAVERYKGAKKCPECGQVVDKKHIREKLAEASATLATAEVSLGDTQVRFDKAKKAWLADIEEMKEIEAARNEHNREHNEALRENDRAKTALEVADKENERTQAAGNPFISQIAGLKERIAGMKSAAQQAMDKLDAEIKRGLQFKFWADAFREIRLNLIDDALAELELVANSHADNLGLRGWRIAFATERETKSGSVSLGFSVALYPPKEDKPIPWQSYSGGERTRWQMAVTFALSEILLGRAGLSPNIEVLDEPTRHLSQQGIDDLLDHLKDRAKDQGRAIFFVDQMLLDKGIFDGVIQLEMDKDGARVVEAP